MVQGQRRSCRPSLDIDDLRARDKHSRPYNLLEIDNQSPSFSPCKILHLTPYTLHLTPFRAFDREKEKQLEFIWAGWPELVPIVNTGIRIDRLVFDALDWLE